MRLNRSDVAMKLAEKTGLSRKDADIVITDMFDIIKQSVIDGNNVSIYGFGSFKPIVREPRTCRNPATGGTVDVDKRRFPKYIPSPAFKKLVNDG